MDIQKLYHILYADELRLDSLYAQLHGQVPTKLTTQQAETLTNAATGEGGIPPVVKGGFAVTETSTKSDFIEYTHRDARYFEVLKRLEIDISKPATALPTSIDGEIHALSGKLSITAMSSNKPVFETAMMFFDMMAKNSFSDTPLSKQAAQAHKKEMQSFINMAEFASKVPAPPSVLLTLKNNKKVYGSFVEQAVRLPLASQSMAFGSTLPFEWTIVGYLYPAPPNKDRPVTPSPDGQTGEQKFFETFPPLVDNMRKIMIPTTEAIIIPLLILR